MAPTMTDNQIVELKQSVCRDIDKRANDLVSISHQIHDKPETNFEEHFAHKILTDYIAEAKLKVTRGAYDLETAFDMRVRGGDGPTVAVLCEYDALPGIGHACGHNIIATAGLGAGLALSAVAEQCGGNLVVMGTPAEEGGGGKIEMARKGAFKDIDAAMMIHPADADLARMNAIAIQNLFVKFHGLAAHAAVSPHKGKNALDAAVLGYMNVAALRQHILPTERIHGIFTNSGEKPNIVPRETEMDWYVRSPTIETLQPLKERVTKCLEGGAMAAGCTVSFDWQKNPFADLVDNIPLLESYVRNAEQFGRKMTTEFLPGTGGGSTDMGNISYLVPSIHPMLQVAPSGVSLHSAAFAEHTKGEAASQAIVDGAKIMAMTAIDMWLSKPLQQRVKSAFGDGVVPAGVI
ncbi:MAG: M20 family peptidase [Actinobacteria bacterium]|nr:M20 family peptidase [Actinomycetota bacterium]NCU81156.1 M20 family peptidase [Acidimicrobiia bacterium]NDC99255.1 M20 family peptidase [bacterium]HBQ51842.1 amidohydrolase [Acidimicrobium sp.]NBP41393.1 M20 family peptidase [Actinomycetota bacterium]